jgi:hypothetical protein
MFETQGIPDTSTSSVQAWSRSFLGLGSIWIPPVLTDSGSCRTISMGEVTMGIRQKSAHGVIIQEDFRKCNPPGEL